MKNTPFVLNNRFLVNQAINNFIDKATGKDIRLEPRLMNVLCFLAANVNQLVSREQLIKEVWNNYGGADDGLNQAISFLRKLLEDGNKKIIETIPTKGYLLNATINEEKKSTSETNLEKETHSTIKLKNNKKSYLIAGLILIIIIAAISLFFWPWNDEDNDQLQVLRVKPMPDIKTDVKPQMIVKPKLELPPIDTLKQRDSIKH